jgi:hypothetical protein
MALTACSSDPEPRDEPEEEKPPALTAAKLLIEHNSTDADTGFQGFADGDPWDELEVTGPDGRIVLARPLGALSGFGLTEFFFETSEPPNVEVPISDVLARLPEGTYTFTGKMVGGAESSMTATFTHTIPAGPVLLSPPDGAEDVDPKDTVVSWERVHETYDGFPDIHVVGYQVIVEKAELPAFPQGFAQPVFSIYLPASATTVKIPPEFMQANAPYLYEVLAIEESGNQTLASAAFMTGPATEPPEVSHEFILTKAKLLIEHNSTDEDTGFQGFADGDPWNALTIHPGAPLVTIEPAGGLANFGLTELFFETSEPPNDEVPIPSVLARIPDGIYSFEGEMVGGATSRLTADFTHTIPAGPELSTPVDGAKDVDPESAVVSWNPVTKTTNGSTNIHIVGYEVIVEKDEEPAFPQSFARPVLSLRVPATVTSVTVPRGFLEPGAAYKYEVLAIEVSGNQTLSSAAFSTR